MHLLYAFEFIANVPFYSVALHHIWTVQNEAFKQCKDIALAYSVYAAFSLNVNCAKDNLRKYNMLSSKWTHSTGINRQSPASIVAFNQGIVRKLVNSVKSTLLISSLW